MTIEAGTIPEESALRVRVRGGALADSDVPLLAVGLARGGSVGEALAAFDEVSGGAIARALDGREFRGARDEIMHLTTSGEPRRVLLVGLGDAKDAAGAIRRGAALAARQARKRGVARFGWWSSEQDSAALEAAAAGLMIGAWEYGELKTPPPEDERRDAPVDAVIFVDDEESSSAHATIGAAIGTGINLARRLGMMPGNYCTPDYLADTARGIAERHGMTVTVLGRAELTAEGMGSFLGVAQGTPQDPKLVALQYQGGTEGAAPVVLVGKGICFDTGGISIKPAQSMEWMKFDMSGAGGVLGAMETIGRLRLPVNVVGVIGATTNMPSGEALKPGDVIRAQNGKYIEIINTDAEGRLVLADLLSYVRRFEPAVVLDAATLTGAVVIALGHTAFGVLSNDDSLAAEVIEAGVRAGERGWQLPLWDEYAELIRSDVADVKNSGGRAAGTISAAMFLREFVQGFPWAHLDIAGTAYSENDLGYIPKGPTGIPVGAFVEFVRGRAR